MSRSHHSNQPIKDLWGKRGNVAGIIKCKYTRKLASKRVRKGKAGKIKYDEYTPE